MLILLRIIAQRSVIYGLSFLTFLGVNPDITVPDALQSEAIKENQLEQMRQALEKNPQKVGSVVPEFSENVEQKIIQIQRDFNESVVEPIQDQAVSVFEDTEESDAIDFAIEDVLVHILCTERTNSYTRLSSGSGVVISDTGIVITNAHVAYPFLLSSQFDEDTYTCAARRGNDSTALYTAEVIYYPADWLKDNINIITEPAPSGTGQDDYAFLVITPPETAEMASESFKYSSTDISPSHLKKDLAVRVAGYPGVNTGVLRRDAFPELKMADTYVADLFTFYSRSADVIQTGANDVAYRGSSGGGVFDFNRLIGVIVTTGTDSSGPYINAITLPYIKQDFEQDTGLDFEDFLNSSPESLRFDFLFSYQETLKSIVSENSK